MALDTLLGELMYHKDPEYDGSCIVWLDVADINYRMKAIDCTWGEAIISLIQDHGFRAGTDIIARMSVGPDDGVKDGRVLVAWNIKKVRQEAWEKKSFG